MTPCTTFGLALVALRRNRMRSLLTILGIVIGVAAVVTMQSMGEGASAYVVGIVFGVVPARKASRLNPLAALRFE